MQITQALAQTGTQTSRDVSAGTQAPQKSGDAFAQVFSEMDHPNQRSDSPGSKPQEDFPPVEKVPPDLAKKTGEETTDAQTDFKFAKVEGDLDPSAVDGQDGMASQKASLAISVEREILPLTQSQPVGDSTTPPDPTSGVVNEKLDAKPVPIPTEIGSKSTDFIVESAPASTSPETPIAPEGEAWVGSTPRALQNGEYHISDGRGRGQVEDAVSSAIANVEGVEPAHALTKLAMHSADGGETRPDPSSMSRSPLDPDAVAVPGTLASGVARTEASTEGAPQVSGGRASVADASRFGSAVINASATDIELIVHDAGLNSGEYEAKARELGDLQEVLPVQRGSSTFPEQTANGRTNEQSGLNSEPRSTAARAQEAADSSKTAVIGAVNSDEEALQNLRKDAGTVSSNQEVTRHALASVGDALNSDLATRQSDPGRPVQTTDPLGAITVRQLNIPGSNTQGSEAQQVLGLVKQAPLIDNSAGAKPAETARDQRRETTELPVQRTTLTLPAAGWSQTMARIELQNTYSFATIPQSVQFGWY